MTKPEACGIDVGLNRLATLSTGERVENQAFFKTALGKLRQANKRLHRRKPGSNNRERAHKQVASLHYRITCLRDDVLYKLTETTISAIHGSNPACRRRWKLPWFSHRRGRSIVTIYLPSRRLREL